MSMLKKAAFAASFAVLSSGVAASGALAAGPTTVSYSSGNLVVDASAGTANSIVVTQPSPGVFRVRESAAGAPLVFGANTGGAVVDSKTIDVVTTGTVTRVIINGGDLNDGLSTFGLTGVPATLNGGTGADILAGGSVGSAFLGGDGNDRATGGSGNDTFIGGNGADDLKGGAGNDTFQISDGAADTVDGGTGTDSARIDAFDTYLNVESLSL